MESFYVGTDQDLVLTGLVNEDGAPVTSANVTATLLDRAYRAAPGGPWPLALNPLGNGSYSVAIPDNLPYNPGSVYILRVDADSSGVKSSWFLDVEIRRRTLQP